MNQPKTDPRILRTRKLIMDTFMELSGKKEFKDITVTDIAAEAMINRATFYYHFEDIYDLLEKVLSEVLVVNLDCSNYQDNELNEEVITSIFVAITNFQKSLSNRCHRGYEDTIARNIREQLEIIFYRMLLKQHKTEEDEGLKITAVILSWGIYGASVEWKRQSNKITPEEFIQLAIPHLLHKHDI
ncbi:MULTISPECIES: TetR family transcriptional regulator [unclassified Sporosarcina]|uniref:TetR family transcriptional regulator n=1 Tax=unclassified Sporosarcina TaxID=2647733 RepID=UPI000C1650AF|nr:MULTISPECIES: TetR family transcriptional regulator [unclassified Sporosarcina]PID00334.1 TetR family transcriptional regulator [Sporosarcina sp. P29]PID06577.1 TetR family transcriptional regulator [Sporosarcina sp. P30]PID09771.1 TetR family transcriptional regulator [Sporosarcina sp. P31]PID13350.1 TetR family transcriptional regulator [Sporosarcina sp. P32b]